MPAIQTTYNATMVIGTVGAFVDMRNRTVISRELESSPPLPFGALVLRGTKDHTCAALGASGGFLGIAALDPTVPASNAGNQYLQGQTVAIMIRGIIWLTAYAPCTPGQQVYYDASGNYTPTSSSNTAIPGATFESTASAGGLVQVRLA